MKAALPLLAFAALTACVPAAKAPPIATTTPVRPAPARPVSGPAPSLPVPAATSWMDAPATPGAWRYADQNGGGMALYSAPGGEPLFMLECDRAAGPALTLVRSGAGRGAGQVVIRTETTSRSLPLRANPAGGEAILAPADPLLDAMALSKGRFAVEADGLPPLYLPSWAEVSRVIEDCR